MELKFSLPVIHAAAETFAKLTEVHKVFAFHGEMGAGKTTFIRAVCEILQAKDIVSSPTFSIINEYESPASKIFHMDLYRVKDAAEAIDAGVEEAFYSGQVCFVEWPEKAPGLFPTETVHCYLSREGEDERKLRINL